MTPTNPSWRPNQKQKTVKNTKFKKLILRKRPSMLRRLRILPNKTLLYLKKSTYWGASLRIAISPTQSTSFTSQKIRKTFQLARLRLLHVEQRAKPLLHQNWIHSSSKRNPLALSLCSKSFVRLPQAKWICGSLKARHLGQLRFNRRSKAFWQLMK